MSHLLIIFQINDFVLLSLFLRLIFPSCCARLPIPCYCRLLSWHATTSCSPDQWLLTQTECLNRQKCIHEKSRLKAPDINPSSRTAWRQAVPYLRSYQHFKTPHHPWLSIIPEKGAGTTGNPKGSLDSLLRESVSEVVHLLLAQTWRVSLLVTAKATGWVNRRGTWS